MASPQQIADAQKFVTESVDADLAFLWSSAGVDIIHQEKIGKHYSTVKKFNVMADTRQEIRDVCKTDYGLDPSTSPEMRASVAAVVAAWESAKEYVTRDNQLRAEAKLTGQPRPVPSTERMAMRRSFENAYGELEDKEVPAAEYLATKLEEVEQNEVTASTLDEVLTMESSVNSTIQTAIDPSGSIKLIKTKVKGKLPTNTEELRLKLKVECNMWLFLAAKYRNRSWLAGLTPMCWSKYTEYLLGDKVFNLSLSRPEGSEPVSFLNPSWNVLLAYEHAMRKKVVKWAMEGKYTLSEGLAKVVTDTELKELHFLTPLLFSHRKTSTHEAPTKWPRTDEQSKGKGKGKQHKGKGKGKGKNKSKQEKGKHGLHSRTPDGRLICYGYNNAGCKGSCGMVHVCRLCFGDHPMTQHSAQAAT